MTTAHAEQVLSLQRQVPSRSSTQDAEDDSCVIVGDSGSTRAIERQPRRSYRGLRSIGKTGGHDPALMTLSLSKPWRSYRGIFLALVLSR
jgi:hypothetical protein